MTKRILIGSLSFALVIIFTGCATIVSGKFQPVTITSDPSGAKVLIKDINSTSKILCETPCTQQLQRDNNTTLTIIKDGFQERNLNLQTKTEGWFWGNLVIGGLPGTTTDSMTGSIYEYSPDTYHVTLTK